MVSITVLTVGKLKEKFYLSACEEYKKRLKGYCSFDLIELPEYRLPENPSRAEIEAGLAREAEEIRKKVPKGAFFCICTPEGKELSSEELASLLKKTKNDGKSSICFLIGSSFGIDAALKKEADFRLSVSKMTFPHHLFRVMLLEQIYRAEAIQAGSKYHK
ncbi:MAG: 23S rRNA (pseudouridine(1915)-N(3))-methyltransferase RlmH [Oscillospiraceae bacterium]|nr:23S rRNA (pseudouridine(1915)-N(3))-methyltransferase RlmH [Oscillospiraceae bacterium]